MGILKELVNRKARTPSKAHPWRKWAPGEFSKSENIVSRYERNSCKPGKVGKK